MQRTEDSIQATHSVEAEQAVIGALLLDNNAFDAVADDAERCQQCADLLDH